ncbi:MAG: hypothetical protein SGPRY_003638 [Prymnesium sp.]
MGRRLDDGEDERQIGRWLGVAGEKGRWKNNLVGKCLREGKNYDDPSVSPVVRQTLLHWAYQLTPTDFQSAARRVKARGAYGIPAEQLLGITNPSKRKHTTQAAQPPKPGAPRKHSYSRALSTIDSQAPSREEQASQREARASRRKEGSEGGKEKATSRPAKEERTRKAQRKSDSPTSSKSEYELRRDETKRCNEEMLVQLGLA